MKKFILFCVAFFTIASELSANPGDTTWVTIYNLRKITAYGGIDTTTSLPTGKRYRKIRLHYILGAYACPSGAQYCASWDYTTQVYAKAPGADTVEIMRLITPYASDWLAASRSNDYTVDVTDYASVLQGNIGIGYNYEGYSWGFTVTLKLELIEGVPPMDALSVKNVYDGYYTYGSTSNPIENHLPAKPFQYTAPVANAFVKNTISGHGSDDSGCSEFCSKYYQLKINNNMISQKQLWRTSCGINDISPQTGTWLLQRGNWCPGAVVDPIYHNITGNTSANSTFSVDIDMELYTAPTQTNASAGYNVVSQLISYSAVNNATDVSIEDVISPTKNPNHARANNICSNPKIRIKNTGSNPVTSVTFKYNLVGGTPQSYTWTGNLAFLQDTVVDLGSSVAVFNSNVSNSFEVKIDAVNGSSGDGNTFNNYYRTDFTDVKAYPGKFVVYMATNGSTSTITGKNETNWKIINDQGTVMYSRTNNANYTTYRDTVNLPSGCYTFIADDDGCDGISWWYYQYYSTNPGSGALRFTSVTNPAIYKNFNGDFGCQTAERFTVGYLLSTNDMPKHENSVKLFPNPAVDELNVLFDVSEYQTVAYTIYDVSGKLALKGSFENISSVSYPVNTTSLNSGVYYMTLQFKDGSVSHQKFVIGR